MCRMSDSALEETKFAPLEGASRVNLETGRTIRQIGETIVFDGRRNLKKLISMGVINTLFIVLFLIINILQDNPPTAAVDYARSYISAFLMPFLILIIAILFGGSIIVEDFEKQTGNLLFPKIERSRLLLGRYIARFTLASIALMIYYAEIALLTYINYETVPFIMWESLGWAILYLHLLLSFVVLMSALLNRIATAQVASLLFVLMGFQMVTQILMFTGSTVEPFFIPTYYGNIITAWFNMPTERFQESPFSGIFDRHFYSWTTPSAEGMIVGVIIYSAILLVGAFLIYRRKQAKS